VPVGTCRKVASLLKELTGREVEVVSNPEFIVEGAAIATFQKPDHVVAGARGKEVADRLHQLYKPYLRRGAPFQVMSPESAEQVKLGKNAFLLIKIGFINQTANDCQLNGADIDDVRRAIGSDSRIGSAFLHPGVGAGGSCLEKDALAQVASAKNRGVELLILQASLEANKRQKRVMIEKISNHFGDDLHGRTIAVWGLAFKPQTDDIREAPSLVLIDGLLERGATVRVHDPAAMGNVRAQYGERMTYCDTPMRALDGADALAILTEWSEYHRPDFAEIRRRLRRPVVFDGRNVYEPSTMQTLGFTYYSIGRQPVSVDKTT
jgi:UDPglucose 6-dehydrogenase